MPSNDPAKRRAQYQRRRETWIAQGLCSRCGLRKLIDGKTCASCRYECRQYKWDTRGLPKKQYKVSWELS